MKVNKIGCIRAIRLTDFRNRKEIFSTPVVLPRVITVRRLILIRFICTINVRATPGPPKIPPNVKFFFDLFGRFPSGLPTGLSILRRSRIVGA